MLLTEPYMLNGSVSLFVPFSSDTIRKLYGFPPLVLAWSLFELNLTPMVGRISTALLFKSVESSAISLLFFFFNEPAIDGSYNERAPSLGLNSVVSSPKLL